MFLSEMKFILSENKYILSKAIFFGIIEINFFMNEIFFVAYEINVFHKQEISCQELILLISFVINFVLCEKYYCQ